MKIINSIDIIKLRNLVVGVLGIYTCYFIGGILHQYVLKQKYTDRFDSSGSYFTQAGALITVQKFLIWTLGLLYNQMFLQKQENISLPIKNTILCASMVFLSTITTNYAIIFVSFPIVTMFKSCNILAVIIVAVFCSRVRDTSLKLGRKKIVVALLVSIGIIMFKVFDPQSKIEDSQKAQTLGIILLFISLLPDGFLPDFQAEIKQKYKPAPTVMMVEINKWCFIISLIYTIVSGQSLEFLDFSWRHPLFVIHMLIMSIAAFVGHIFIYRMVKQFKQHMVPFVITTRKIISVGISMVYFKHVSSVAQICGILIVFTATLFQFLSETLTKKQILDKNELVQQKIENIYTLKQSSSQRDNEIATADNISDQIQSQFELGEAKNSQKIKS